METTRVRCGNPDCGRVLDESPSLAPSEREPCPDCASSVRTFDVSLSDTVQVSASLSWTKIHEETRKNWPWLLVTLALAVAGAVVGEVLAGLPGLFVGLALALLAVPAGFLALTRVREIEHGGDR